LIVRRQPKAAGDQLAFHDLGGWRLHAIITNVVPTGSPPPRSRRITASAAGSRRTPSGR
jgi:hypothetical protein